MTLYRIAAAALSALLLACSPGIAPQTAQSEGNPALWKVEGEEGSAYLFGTIHLLPEGVEWSGPVLDEAIAGSDRLILEITGTGDSGENARLFAELATSPGLPPVEDRLDPALRADYDKVVKSAPIKTRALDKLESWAAALTLANRFSAGLDLKPSEGVESVLTRRFEDMDKPVSAFETVAEQFGFFDRLSEEDQNRMLNAVIGEADEARGSFDELLAAWLAGDIETLGRSAREGIMESPTVRETLLDARNRNWADLLGEWMGDGETLFVAVGAGHLTGEGSLPDLLAEKGYRVERLQ